MMLLGIVLEEEMPSFQNEHLHDVNIIDDGVSLTITVQRSGVPAQGDISAMRADQILTGAFRMADEVGGWKPACKAKARGG